MPSWSIFYYSPWQLLLLCLVGFNIVNTNESSIFTEENSVNHMAIEGYFTEPQNSEKYGCRQRLCGVSR